MVKVSVIIPVYNTGQYLSECIDSVICQTLKDIEILIIDDGSPDNAGEICDEYAKKDARIKVFHQENLGVAIARNKGMDNAIGEYLYFLDSDDMITPNFCEIAYNIAKANNSDLTICDDRNFGTCSLPEIVAVATFGTFVKNDFLKKHPDIRFPEKMQPSEDGIFSHKILVLTNKVSFSSFNHYFYRQHHQQDTNLNNRIKNSHKYRAQSEEILDLVEEFYDKHNLWDKEYYRLANFIQNELFLCRYSILESNNKEKKELYLLIHNFFNKYLKKYFSKKILNKFHPAFKALLRSKNYEIYTLNRKLHQNKFIHENFLLYRTIKSNFLNLIQKTIKKIKKIKASIKIVKPHEQIFMNNFLKNISPEKILVVEMNDFHNEVIPGYLKYLNDLGYDCDVLITSLINKENIFFNIPKNLYENLYHTRYFIIKKLLQNPRIKKYKKILITSNYIYLENCILTNYKNLCDKNKILFVDHNIKYVTPEVLKQHNIICLNNFERKDLTKNMVNPHYFGNIKITPKNNITQFLIVGRIKNSRQNYNLITDTINKLKLKNIFNYKITLVGFDLGGEINPQLANEINLEYKSRLNFEEMYKEIENSDFLLTLFDDTNPEHNKYKTSVTSGQIQLSYGFLKPSIISESFAPYFGFNKNNSLLFKNNDDFINVIENAINLPQNEYEIMQNHLKTSSEYLYKNSLNNLKELLNEQ